MKYLVVSLLAVFSVTGCGVFGGSNPYENVDIDTVRKGILVANAELRGANLLLKEVIRSRSISSDDAQRALDGLRDARTTLQDALTAVDISGDPLEGQDRLDSAIRSLDLVLSILAPAAPPPQASVGVESGADIKEAA